MVDMTVLLALIPPETMMAVHLFTAQSRHRQ
jgi:hypothetical protein